MKIIDVARYLIYLSGENNNLITSLKLQKLLYYCQGFSYAWDHKSLFEDEFEAWQYGPANRTVYDHFKKYENRPISTDKGANLDMDSDKRETIEAVWENFSGYSDLALVDRICKEEPWKDAVRSGENISNMDIKKYFQKYYSQSCVI